MGIGGKVRENNGEGFSKMVGLYESKIVAINPSLEEYKEVLGIELKEDSKATEYIGESKEGKTYLRINVWTEDVKTGNKYPIQFYLENKEKENKDATKKQYINNVGVCSWATSDKMLPEWFSERDYRVAYVGEEELYNFLRTWLSSLDYRSAETTLELDWKKLMRGNVKDLKDQIDGEWANNVVALATVKIQEKDGEMKEYQSVFNKAFLSPYSLKQFRLVDYNSPMVLENLNRKKPKEMKAHERFVINVTSEYGCKDCLFLGDLKEYVAEDYLQGTDKVISESGSDY